MELRQLRYFIAVAECLSFSRAAEELHITVPPLSRQIRQLEEEFNVQLFIRNRRRVILTDTGRLFLREAKTLADQMARLTSCVRHAKHGDTGSVRIGIGVHLGERVSRAVAEHFKRHPSVEIETIGMFSAQQNAALVENKIDIGFLRPPIDRVHLDSELLFEEGLLVLINRENPLAKRKSVRIRELSEETLLLQDQRVSSGLHEKVLDLFAKAGVSPRIVQLPPDPLPTDEVRGILLAARRGVFIVADESPVRLELGHAAAAVPVDEPGARVGVHMAWRSGETSGAALSFMDSVRRVFGRRHNARRSPLTNAALGDLN